MFLRGGQVENNQYFVRPAMLAVPARLAERQLRPTKVRRTTSYGSVA
jgi:hypothetical protein